MDRGPSQLITDGFNTSTASSFLNVYTRVSSPPKPQGESPQLLLVCANSLGLGVCGGLADRAKGIPYAVSIALITKRRLVLDASLFTNSPPPVEFREANYHFLVDGYATDPANIRRLVEDPFPAIYLTINTEGPSLLDFCGVNEDCRAGVEVVQTECSVNPYICGAAALWHTKAFQHGNVRAKALVEALERAMVLPRGQYLALHVRTGGSSLTLVDDGGQAHAQQAAPWEDGYASDIPQAWIDAFRHSTFSNCKWPLALVSDSSRLRAEIEFAVRDRIKVVHCCSQPLHRDRFLAEDFFFQEVVDLFVLSHSRRIIGGLGGFVVLGKYWKGGPGPEFQRVGNRTDVLVAMERLLKDSGCQIATVLQ